MVNYFGEFICLSSTTNEYFTIGSTVSSALFASIGFIFQVTQLASKNDLLKLASKQDVEAVKVELKKDIEAVKVELKKDFEAVKVELNQVHMKTKVLSVNAASKKEIEDLTNIIGTAVVYVSDEVTLLSADKMKQNRSEFLAKLFTKK
jgi:hypothetical protein